MGEESNATNSAAAEVATSDTGERLTPAPDNDPKSVPSANASPSPRRISRVTTPPPPVKLDIYEGPLDLLLDLIRKQQVSIYDIPIAQITAQYLDYLHLMEAMNIDVAGEFVFMAATLIHIKSRMLLPPDPSAPPEEQEDPRTELVQRLLEHEQFKNAAEMLLSKRMVEDATWSQPGIGEFVEAEDEPGLAVSIFDLISAFRQILERAKARPQLAIRREEVSVADMMEHVRQILLQNRHPVRLDDLASGYLARQALIALFLALLEMVRLHAIQLRQKELFAPVTVHRNARFEEIMAQPKLDLLEAGLDENTAIDE
jgi:segregation and condensation protein A